MKRTLFNKRIMIRNSKGRFKTILSLKKYIGVVLVSLFIVYAPFHAKMWHNSNLSPAAYTVNELQVASSTFITYCIEDHCGVTQAEFEKAKKPAPTKTVKNKPFTTGKFNRQVLVNVCKKYKQDEKECPKMLETLTWVESSNGKKPIGDGGKSQGWYHIQYRLHGLSLTCVYDLKCSSDWVLARLIRNGYPEKGLWSIATHNSYTPSVNKRYQIFYTSTQKKYVE